MKKDDFKPHTRYTVTRRNEQGKLVPGNFYVYKLYDPFMIVRMTDGTGLLTKIAYDDVVKIVKTREVPKEDQFHIPDAVLKENVWASRTAMMRYSSSSHTGK